MLQIDTENMLDIRVIFHYENTRSLLLPIPRLAPHLRKIRIIHVHPPRKVCAPTTYSTSANGVQQFYASCRSRGKRTSARVRGSVSSVRRRLNCPLISPIRLRISERPRPSLLSSSTSSPGP